MSNENIIREIDEELRSDQMRALWRNFGPWIIVAAVLVVVGVAGYEAWNWWQGSNASRSSDQFYSALELAEGTDVAAAQKALDEVEAQGSGAYPSLARFREAALLAKQGQTAQAVAAYDALSTTETNPRLRELALVLAAYVLIDGGDAAQVEQRVGGLVAPDNPMRIAAREAIGLAKYKAGDLAGAQQSFEDALNDPSASQDTRTRLSIYLAQLVAEGAPKPEPQAEAAAAGTEAAPAEAATPAPADTSVGDAPALDVTPPAPATEAPAPAAQTPAN